MENDNKTTSATADGIINLFVDTNRHQQISLTGKDITSRLRYEKPVKRFRSKDLQRIQDYGTAKRTNYQEYEDYRYNFNQMKLYHQCLYGLRAVPPEEMDQLTFEKKLKILQNHKKTQQLINLSKWNLVNKRIDNLFNQLFSKIGTGTKKFLELTEDISMDDNAEINYLDLKSLGGRDVIIKKLVEVGILPANFYEIKRS